MAARALIVLCLLVGLARADSASLLRGLDTEDPAALQAAVAAIETAPASPDLADVLFAAGRACEDRLHDPVRALAIYERITRDFPDAGVSIAAGRRATQLRSLRGHAREAADLAQLMADADQIAPAEIRRRAEALAAAAWPGALDASLWLADWLCRTEKFADANARYAQLIAASPDAPQARLARRNAAGCAIEARDWSRAEQLTRALPSDDDVSAAVRNDLLESIDTQRNRERLYSASWLVLALVLAAMLASLAEAMLRGSRRLPAATPPVEVLYIAPVAVVMVAAAFAIDRLIAPAVVMISVAGLAFAWLSGATLDLLRARSRPVRLRALVHVVACMLGILAVGYIAMWRDGLIDMFSETVRFGPGA